MKKITAIMLRNVLLIVMVILVGAIVLGFSYGLSVVRSSATLVNQTVADAGASNNLAAALSNAEQQLAQGEAAIAKANSMFVTAGNYQDRAISDIRRYASNYNIHVSDLSFNTLSGGNTTPRYGVNVTLGSPLNYRDFIRFLDAIEGNVPKMQVISVQLAHPANQDAEQVRISNLVIGLFSR